MWEHWLKDIEEEAVEQRGMEKCKEEIVKNLLVLGDYSPEKISEIACMPIERVRALVN